MLEISFAVVVVAGAALVIGRIRGAADRDIGSEEEFVDLPCPWCQAPTTESDAACPACAQPFGVTSSI